MCWCGEDVGFLPGLISPCYPGSIPGSAKEFNANIAQLVEHTSHTRGVAGSSPVVGTRRLL